ncbi:MAG TPA: plastocyanin/azurin family copper-binding protein [Anaeromyxobacteraceae bacterium]|nr:plastocyanin/azurin family copper-binding protein [Anaeromyxobacteraceae bacterium]
MRFPWKGTASRLATAALAALPLATLARGGSVAGRVEAQPARLQDETVVYLEEVPGTPAPATHQVDQKGMKFIPMVLVVAAGDTVEFLNHDGVVHNVHSRSGDGFDLGWFRPLEKRSRTFPAPGVYRIGCLIHPDMLGWVFVGRNRYAAAVDAKGRYAIEDVPAGTYALAVWNANLPGARRSVTVVAGKAVEENFSLKR